MNRTDREATIQQIADELSLAATEPGQQRILTAWRDTLQKEPASLASFQIDSIVREVRRLIGTSR
jgi:hypothetical protein